MKIKDSRMKSQKGTGGASKKKKECFHQCGNNRKTKEFEFNYSKGGTTTVPGVNQNLLYAELFSLISDIDERVKEQN